MSDIIRLRDADGREHHTARGSQAAEQLLRDGAVDLDARPEVPDAPEPAAPGDDLDSGATDSGPGDGQRTPRASRRRDRDTGEAQSEPGGERQSTG